MPLRRATDQLFSAVPPSPPPAAALKGDEDAYADVGSRLNELLEVGSDSAQSATRLIGSLKQAARSSGSPENLGSARAFAPLTF